MQQKAILEVRHISKSFGPTKALIDVSFEVFPGEVRGLIGENGSGKSTISSIISGLQNADSGEMFYQGAPYQPADVIHANQLGVCMIVQEQSTIETITVAANIFIGKEKQFSSFGVMNTKKMETEAGKALSAIGSQQIQPDMRTKRLTFEDRKLIEIARAFYTDPKLLIVDETTTALSRNGREILYAQMKKHCEAGGAVLFISHDIDEVMNKSDAVTVLRDGALTATIPKAEFSENGIRSLMVGREISNAYYRTDQACVYDEEIVLKAQNVSGELLRDVTVELHKGEILGIGGLTECGMHELGRLLFGVAVPKKGCVLLSDGGHVKNPDHAIKHHLGYLSKNRDREALMTASSIRDNICITAYHLLSRLGFISATGEKKFSVQWAREINIKAFSVDSMVSSLSGGNKQKVVIAKWLANGTEIFIMDCPTRGIDVGVKAAIYRLMENLKKDGKSILMISEELPELLGMSDRILILKDGKMSGEYFRNETFTEHALIGAMI